MEVQNVTFHSFSPTINLTLEGSLSIDLYITNPNFTPIKLLDIEAKTYAGPIQIGTLNLVGASDLPARGSGNATLFATIAFDPRKIIDKIPSRDYQKLLESFALLLAGDLVSGNLRVKLDGTVLVSLGGFPVNTTLSKEFPFAIPNSSSTEKRSLSDPNEPTTAVGWFLLNFFIGIFLFFLVIVLCVASEFLNKRVTREIQSVPFVTTHRSDNQIGKVYGNCVFKLGLRVGKKLILEDVTGAFHPGRVTAIMGPSGCGKTSLLNVLSGRAEYGKCVGDVFVNERKTPISNWKREFGFVPQEDTMHRELSVEEILFHSAYTRASKTKSFDEIVLLVENTIELLGLSQIRSSVIGDEENRGISGGQRKRVNIAMELVASPGILFLDEPTSGLDSSSSTEVCALLSKLSRRGLTIVTVIHQPRAEIFKLIDDIVLLGVGGKPVFIGPTKDLESFFTESGFVCPAGTNPSDFYLDVITGNTNEEKEENDRVEKSKENLQVRVNLDDEIEQGFQLSTCEILQKKWQEKVIKDAPVIHCAADTQDAEFLFGNFSDFLLYCVLAFMIPLFPLISFFSKQKQTLHAQFGTVIGITLAVLGWTYLLIYLFSFNEIFKREFGPAFLIVVSCEFACGLAFQIGLYVHRTFQNHPKAPVFPRLFMSGIYLGPLVIPLIYLAQRNRKVSSALVGGCLTGLAHWIIFTTAFFIKEGDFTTYNPIFGVAIFFAGALLTKAIASIYRHFHVF